MHPNLMAIPAATRRVDLSPSGLRYHELMGRISPYRTETGPRLSLVAGGLLIAFEIIEAAAMGVRFWLQPFCFVIGLAIVALALRRRSAR
jgi:hypothetical protein